MKNTNNEIQDVLGNVLGNALYDKVTVDHKEILLRFIAVKLVKLEKKLERIEKAHGISDSSASDKG